MYGNEAAAKEGIARGYGNTNTIAKETGALAVVAKESADLASGWETFANDLKITVERVIGSELRPAGSDAPRPPTASFAQAARENQERMRRALNECREELERLNREL